MGMQMRALENQVGAVSRASSNERASFTTCRWHASAGSQARKLRLLSESTCEAALSHLALLMQDMHLHAFTKLWPHRL